ncbi:hypothetical protein EON65_37365 [archaeon]|nr:MAG: hypothetical protein EON65_37365 [archaeon]
MVIGKVWALRQFYKWAIQLFDTANCDQYLLNRHVLMVPDLYHIDYDQALSSAGYKNHVLLNALDSNDLYISNDLALKVRLVSANKNTSISSSRDVLIFHANVKHSNKLYDGITRVYGESLKVNFMAEGKIDASKIRSLWEIVDRGV